MDYTERITNSISRKTIGDLIESSSDQELLLMLDELLEWMEDPNRDCSIPIADALCHRLPLWENKLHEILSPNFHNVDLKSSVLYLVFYRQMDKYDFHNFLNDLSRIAKEPTK